jgi:protein-disulfide isomerase
MRGRLGVRVAVLLALAVMTAAGVVLIGGGNDDGTAPKPKTAAGAASDLAGVRETADLLRDIPQDGLVLGSKKAPITMVEIVDLQCPFCRKHSLETQPKIIEKLVRTGRVQLHLVPIGVLGPDSQRMQIVLLRLAQRDLAWQFAQLVYRNQGQEGTGYATDAWLRKVVSAVPGADPADASTLASTTPDKQIAGTAQVAAAIAQASFQQAGRGGTPFFTIGASGTPAQLLTPILAGAPPEAYETILKAVKAIEAGRPPTSIVPPGGPPSGTTPSNATGA